MKEDVKAAWTAALESGDYQQGFGALHRTSDGEPGSKDEFCCLGVLCDLALQAGVVGREPSDDGTHYVYKGDMDDPTPSVLPFEVMTWAGLGDCDPIIKSDEVGINGLLYLNDSMKLDFPEIARHIRERL